MNLAELRQAAIIQASLREEPCECEVAGQPLVNKNSPVQFREMFREHCTYCLGKLRPGQPIEHHLGGERPIRLEVED